ncbi:TorF family putative porin [Rheinheimera nanhaiensis]|uniref:Periplasmic or outer membrane protein n=1 Tax=Rheinheimera nanhaiensis E407-8 TaxID=562729 RepID=I1E1F0_9GAMM|nr:TorF family putative porin [Rheinheimera nanhaiensis]GAB60128.1 hypothetical protein RNAN_3142 [Rheinheimera nanhaiensis E407-8]
MKTYLIPLLLLSSSALADSSWSFTLTGTSNYLFNGVSQTDKNPALQPGLNWDAGNGFYAGSWASNVDFGEGTKLEWDAYIGYYTELENGLAIDTGFAQYTYHGMSQSKELNFPEIYLKFAHSGYNLNLWYSYDYFGFGGGHYVIMLTKTLELSDNWSLLLGVDRSTSTDTAKYSWEGDSSFMHWQAMLKTQYQGLDIAIGYHDTSLNERWGDAAILLTVSKTFSW